MAAVSDSGSPRGGGGGGGRPRESWRRHIIREMEHRDRSQQAVFQDLVRLYSKLLDKTSLTKGILSCSRRRPSADGSLTSLQNQNQQLKKTTGELAYQVVELQQQIRIKDGVLEEQHSRMEEEEARLAASSEVRGELQKRVDRVQEENGFLKVEYDCLLERQKEAESQLREEKVRGGRLLEEMIHLKKQAAARMNSRNERRSRAREASLQKELQSAARSKVTIDSSSSALASKTTSPTNESREESTERRQTRLFRSASVTSPRILSTIKELFDRKRRGHSVCSLDEDMAHPIRFCLSARVPARALHVLEAHDQGINAVRFSSSSDLLATGGTDRVIKVWEVRAGLLTHRATLDGSNEGITCTEFDHTGSKILAASYDKSALLWKLDDPVPKVTLTGHSRKVTAARFSGVQQAVTGGADRTLRLWDLTRAACVKLVDVTSYCSDLVCSENSIISGHYDCKIRVWDNRAVSCVQELPAPGKVTSLDLSSDLRLLLSCCRDDCLQLVDLRKWSHQRVCFRADGFKCGSDSTKAVISPDGGYVAAGSADGAVYIWNVSTGNLETRLSERHSSSISAVSWSLSGEYVVSVDKSRRAVLWSDI